MIKHYVVVIQRVNTSYLARCMELGIASQGDTPEEAQEGLREAIELYAAGMRRTELSWGPYPDADSRDRH